MHFPRPPRLAVCLLTSLVLCVLLRRGTARRSTTYRTRIRDLFTRPRTYYNFYRDPENETEQRDDDHNHGDATMSYAEYFVQKGEHLLTHHRDTRGSLRNFRLAGLLGHAGALTTAGLQLLAGDDGTRNLPSAVRHLRLAANLGSPEAQATLASLHSSGLAGRGGVQKDDARAVLFLTFAAEGRSPVAATALAFRYLTGHGVAKSCLASASHYRRAARAVATDARYWPSALNFVDGKPPLPSGLVESPATRLDEKVIARGLGEAPPIGNGNAASTAAQDADLVQYYTHLAAQGVASSRTTLGALHYFGGHGIQPDEQVARGHLEAAAAADHGQAHTMLGHLDMRARRNDSAMVHFMTGAAHSDYMAHYALGMIHLHGLLGKTLDYSRAKMHFELTLDLGNSHGGALFQLGMLYWHGRGVPRNTTEAFRYFRKAADAGNVQSKWNIGALYTSDATKAKKAADREALCQRGVQYLKSVAEAGEWPSVLDMAMDRVEAGDWFGALHRYTQAAHAGIELAQYNAAFILERVPPSRIPELRHWSRRRALREATQLYALSAKQGHTDALVRAAHAVYEETQDYRHAASIYTHAASLGNAEGMVSLALMYARGLGVAQSRDRAVAYLHGASAADPDAVAPAAIALLAVRVYWLMQDVWSNIATGPPPPPPHTAQHSQRTQQTDQTRHHLQPHDEDGDIEHTTPIVSTFASDVAIVGALLIGLLAVLIARSKRLARQTDQQDAPPQLPAAPIQT